MDGLKAQLYIKKHGGGMIILVIVLVESRNYGCSGNISKDK